MSRLLYRRSAQLEHLLNSLPIGVAVVESDGKATYANYAFHGHHPDISALIAQVREPFDAVIRERRQIAPVQIESSCRIGLYPHDAASIIVISTAAGKPSASRNDDRQNQKLVINSLEFIGSPVAVITDSLQVAWINDQFAGLLGYKAAELVNSSYRDIDPDTPIDIAADNVSVRANLRHKSGTQLPVEIRSRSATHGGSPVRVLTIVQPSPDDAPDGLAMEALERVSGQLSHRLNNLLTVILSYAELIRSEYGSVEALSDELQKIEEAAHSASRITQDLLTFSRGRPVSSIVIEVDRAVASMASLFRSLAGAVSVRIFLHAPDAHVRFGLKDLETVLLNIVRNAREAFDDDQGTITIQTARIDPASPDDRSLLARLGLKLGSDYVRITVTDTGRSFPPEHQACLFEPFFTTKPGAQGMGLPVTYGIVKRSGGSVAVERLASGGTRASIVLRQTSLTIS